MTPTLSSNEDALPSLKNDAAWAAQHRGNAMATTVRRESPSSSRASFETLASSRSDTNEYLLLENTDIAMQRLGCGPENKSRNAGFDVPGGEGYEAGSTEYGETCGDFDGDRDTSPAQDDLDEQQPKKVYGEIYNGSCDGSYNVPTPDHYRGGVLSQLLKLYKGHEAQDLRHNRSSSHSRLESGSMTPDRRKWYEQNNSQDTLASLIAASTKLAKPAQPQSDGVRKPRPQHKRTGSMANRLSALWTQEETHVREHIADTLARQSFILKVCRALMLYGAPTHRLEEYLTMTARALEIEAQFLYIPGCMVIAFDDASTHTTEVKLVRLAQGIDLGKLKDVHRIYKEVIHDVTSVEEATGNLDELMATKPKFHPWLRVLVFGLTSLTAAPFSFHARLIDLPMCFLFGCLVGMLQLIVAPMSPLYSNVLEVSATVLVSFLARAFGSIRGGDLFCFSALAQGGIVMLLPGYMFCKYPPIISNRAVKSKLCRYCTLSRQSSLR